jgi:hypothetical protein
MLAHVELFAGFFLSAGAADFFVVERGIAAAVSLLTHETSSG